MKIKIFSCIFALLFTLFSFTQIANAMVNSKSDIYQKINKLNIIVNTDFLTFVNKSELVGYRLDSFGMSSSSYQNQARMYIQNLNDMLVQIRKIENSMELSDTDKNIQIGRFYQDANRMMFEMDSQTMNFLMNLNQVMPSITYTRFVNKYQDFYNGLNLTNADIKIK